MKLLITAFLVTLPLFAALPPMVQAERELKAILNDPKLHEYVSTVDVFERIEKTQEGYLIVTSRHQVAVIVHYLEPKAGFVGPAQFTLEFKTVWTEDAPT